MGMLEKTNNLMNIKHEIELNFNANVEEIEFENISIPYNVVEFQKSINTTGIYRKHKQKKAPLFNL